MDGLRIENLTHGYQKHTVLNDVSLEIIPGEIACLLGPSGCGKTTLLRVAAGLERRQAGRIFVGGELVADDTVRLSPEQRGVGFMFQDFALFPNLTVFNNVAFGVTDRSPADRDQRVSEALRQVDMAGSGALYPHVLSGGQQQRVALARALAPEPRVLMLDEPFSGLDETLRIQIREDTLSILKATGVATLMVTHNPEEAMFMADRMMVMGASGRIHQSGSPASVYTQPIDKFVASFFGQTNCLEGVVSGGVVATPLGEIAVPGMPDGQRVTVIVRTDGIQLDTNSAEGVPVLVESARPLGRTTFVRFSAKHSDPDLPTFKCRTPGVLDKLAGKTIGARLLPEHAFVFAADDGIDAAG